MTVDEVDKDFRLLRERLAGAVTVTEWDAIVRLQYSAQRAIRERDALRDALRDLIDLAEYAMREANKDGGEFEIDAELKGARTTLTLAGKEEG